MSSRRACYLGDFDRSTQDRQSQIICCCHDVYQTTTKEAIDWQDQQKTESNQKAEVVGCKPESDRFVENQF